jgi:uncharacterized membrane protein
MLTAVFLATAALLFALHVPLLLGKVPPNRFYGFRTPRVVSDERVWYPVNKVAGRNGIVLAGGVAGLGVLTAFTVLAPWMMALFAVFLVTNLGATFVSASQIVAEIDRRGPKLDTRSTFERGRQNGDRDALLRKLKGKGKE